MNVSGKRKTPSRIAFEAKYREKPREIAKYLNDAMATDDAVLFMKAIGDMVRAQGVTRFSEKAEMRRDIFIDRLAGK